VLVHASTLSVFVSSDGAGEGGEETLSDAGRTVLYGGYAQSKAMAEARLAALAADPSGGPLAVKVVRYGLLVPPDGRDLPTDHFLRTLLGALSRLSAVPVEAEEAFVDLTRIDQAAAAALAIADAPREGVFHYANPRPCSLTEVVGALGAAMAAHGRILGTLNHAGWGRKLEGEAGLPRALLESAFSKTGFLQGRARRAPVLNADLFQTTGRRYAIGRALACGAPVPEAPGTLIARLAAPFGPGRED
jgi:nucleoside-diphosphate-sugar epimerase